MTPDIPTEDTSIFAYYNPVEEHDLENWNPENIVDHSNVNEHEIYDNGILITDWGSTRYEIRVKSDGWVTVRLDDTEDGNTGPWEFVTWDSEEAEETLRPTVITVCEYINDNLSLSTDDISVYDYLYNATHLTFLTIHVRNSHYNNGSGESKSGSYSVTDEATLHRVVGGGITWEDTDALDSAADWEPGSGGFEDVTNQIEPNTEYDVYVNGTGQSDNFHGDDTAEASVRIVAFWS